MDSFPNINQIAGQKKNTEHHTEFHCCRDFSCIVLFFLIQFKFIDYMDIHITIRKPHTKEEGTLLRLIPLNERKFDFTSIEFINFFIQ